MDRQNKLNPLGMELIKVLSDDELKLNYEEYDAYIASLTHIVSRHCDYATAGLEDWLPAMIYPTSTVQSLAAGWDYYMALGD